MHYTSNQVGHSLAANDDVRQVRFLLDSPGGDFPSLSGQLPYKANETNINNAIKFYSDKLGYQRAMVIKSIFGLFAL